MELKTVLGSHMSHLHSNCTENHKTLNLCASSHEHAIGRASHYAEQPENMRWRLLLLFSWPKREWPSLFEKSQPFHDTFLRSPKKEGRMRFRNHGKPLACTSAMNAGDSWLTGMAVLPGRLMSKRVSKF